MFDNHRGVMFDHTTVSKVWETSEMYFIQLVKLVL